MAAEINQNNQFLENYLEYNGFVFPKRLQILISELPVYGESGRIIISRKYLLKVKTWITPKDINIPAVAPIIKPDPNPIEGGAAPLPPGFSRPANPVITIPGTPAINISGFAFGATTDAEMIKIRCKLEENGKTLRMLKQGFGDIYCNTIDPYTGIYVQDISFGPSPKVIQFRPVGFEKAWYLEWEVELNLLECCTGLKLDFNKWWHRIVSFTYDLNSHINKEGKETRNIRGMLKIVNPVNRTGAFVNTTRSMAISNPQLRNIMVKHIIPPIPPGPYSTQQVYEPIKRSIDIDQSRIINPSQIYPTGEAPNFPASYPLVDNKDIRYLYETVDQYRDLIVKNMPVPENFQRMTQEFNINKEKNTITFNIQDVEGDNYSFIENYADWEGSHKTESRNQGHIATFSSILQMTFNYPRYVYSGIYMPKALKDKYPSPPILNRTEVINTSVEDTIRNLIILEFPSIPTNILYDYDLLIRYVIPNPLPGIPPAFGNAFNSPSVFAYPWPVQDQIDNNGNNIFSVGVGTNRFYTRLSALLIYLAHLLNPTRLLTQRNLIISTYYTEAPTGYFAKSEPFKRIPNKLESYIDFIKIVYQRFAVAAFTTNSNRTSNPSASINSSTTWLLYIINTALWLNNSTAAQWVANALGITQSSSETRADFAARAARAAQIALRRIRSININNRGVSVGTIYPTIWRVDENLKKQNISFTMGFFIASDLQNIFYMTGHGLPVYSAATLTNPIPVGYDFDYAILGHARNVFESRYLMTRKHKDWLSAMRFASVNARGTANNYLGNDNDRTIRACDFLDTQEETNLPSPDVIHPYTELPSIRNQTEQEALINNNNIFGVQSAPRRAF